MDDVLLIGSSERDMDKAMALLTDYMRERLGLTIKPEWRIYATDYIGADGKHHGKDIDMMGYRIYCDHIAIRRRTFRRHRRKIMRARARLGKGQELGLKESRQLMSCKGKFKHSNSRKVSRRLSLAKVANAASQVISAFDSEQQNHINEERRQWDEINRTCGGEAAGNPVHSSQGWNGGCLAAEEHRSAAVPF